MWFYLKWLAYFQGLIPLLWEKPEEGYFGFSGDLLTLPSTFINPSNGWFLPVQCFAADSFNLSVNDQTLKYGSCVING